MSDPTPNAPLNAAQQIYCLSMFANVVNQVVGTQDDIQKKMQAALAVPLLGLGWDLVWGPKVLGGQPISPEYPEGQTPTNTWYIARNRETDPTKKQVVIAIAGTSSKSNAGWKDINLLIDKTVEFSSWIAGWKNQSFTPTASPSSESKPFCSLGTGNGVANLLREVSPAGAVAPGTHIYQVLPKSEELQQGTKVVVTGHSMGGALAPTLALGLVLSDIAGLAKNNVQVYPSAGASPGNQSFSDTFSSNLPPSGSGYQAINKDFYNTLDIVPQAWSVDQSQDRNLDNIMGKIYSGITGLFRLTLTGTVTYEKGQARKSGMTYRGIVGEAFTSTNPPLGPPPTNLDELKKSALAQHVTAYLNVWGLFGRVKDFQDDMLSAPGIEPAKFDVIGISEIPEVQEGYE